MILFWLILVNLVVVGVAWRRTACRAADRRPQAAGGTRAALNLGCHQPAEGIGSGCSPPFSRPASGALAGGVKGMVLPVRTKAERTAARPAVSCRAPGFARRLSELLA
jgi:hypothetical protein